jgi:hypothetical protein
MLVADRVQQVGVLCEKRGDAIVVQSLPTSVFTLATWAQFEFEALTSPHTMTDI